jgi:hypothetical protein
MCRYALLFLASLLSLWPTYVPWPSITGYMECKPYEVHMRTPGEACFVRHTQWSSALWHFSSEFKWGYELALHEVVYIPLHYLQCNIDTTAVRECNGTNAYGVVTYSTFLIDEDYYEIEYSFHMESFEVYFYIHNCYEPPYEVIHGEIETFSQQMERMSGGVWFECIPWGDGVAFWLIGVLVIQIMDWRRGWGERPLDAYHLMVEGAGKEGEV